MNRAGSESESTVKTDQDTRGAAPDAVYLVTLFLCGEVMIGRGIDQILPRPNAPTLYEPSVQSAMGYVDLAEQANGPIPRPVPLEYIWGDALKELKRVAPDVRIVNLETAVTKSENYWKSKQVHYRMNPENAGCLPAACIDCCAIANNHILDWGESGLTETLSALKKIGVKSAGAGRNLREAQEPAVFELADRGRLLVFAFGSDSSGIPAGWAASDKKTGVNFLDETSPTAAWQVQLLVEHAKRIGDLVVVSIHWGQNWDYEIPHKQRVLAHELIDHASVDIVYGHSSHHVKALEVYRGKLILYGCGDFLTDYEGIPGYEAFRGDLGLMYFVSLDCRDGMLVRLQMTPTRVRRFHVVRASKSDTDCLLEVLNREGRQFGNRVKRDESHRLTLHWE